ncbi:unnamed protein product [Diamesa serratosioi]
MFSLVGADVALFMGVIANGIVYVSAMSYVNVRATKGERPMTLAMCHVWKLIGISLVILVRRILQEIDDNKTVSLDVLFKYIGYVLLGATGLFIILLLLNEFRQRQGLIYNYRDSLDHDLSIANNYCKLFSKNEVLIERNTTVSSMGMWKSTENLLPKNKNNYTNLWTIYMLLQKLHGVVFFHYFLVLMTFDTTVGFLDYSLSDFLVIMMMVIGAIVGCLLVKFVQISKVYCAMAITATIALGVSHVFFSKHESIGAICLWIYFIAMSISIALPDIALLEIAKIRFNEGALAAGFFVELIGIGLLQKTQSDVHNVLGDSFEFVDKYYLTTTIATVVVVLVTSCIFLLHYPDTFNKSLLQIQNELVKHEGYFVFSLKNNQSINRELLTDANYLVSGDSVNVFENHAKSMSDESGSVEYIEATETLPPPPTNTTNFDYNKDIKGAPAIIPRVNINRATINTMYRM